MEDKSLVICAVTFLLFFGIMFITFGYSDNLTNDCKTKGMAAGRPAIEIQAVCGRR